MASKHRMSVIRALSKNNLTPKEISLASNIPLSHVSNLLRELTDEGVVVCLNPQLKRGRVYALTGPGKEIAAAIAEHALGKERK